MAAGINTIYTETVHKSDFALMGQAVPVERTLMAGVFVGIKFAASPLHAFFIAASGVCSQ